MNIPLPITYHLMWLVRNFKKALIVGCFKRFEKSNNYHLTHKKNFYLQKISWSLEASAASKLAAVFMYNWSPHWWNSIHPLFAAGRVLQATATGTFWANENTWRDSAWVFCPLGAEISDEMRLIQVDEFLTKNPIGCDCKGLYTEKN